MPDQFDTLGTYISLTMPDGCFAIHQSHEEQIARAYEAWHCRGENTILKLTLANGDETTVAASLIADFTLSTPQGRADGLRRQLEHDRWAADVRRAHGWVPGQDEV